MANLDQGISPETGVGATGLVDPETTALVTSLCDGDAAAKLMSAPGTTPSSPESPGDKGSNAREACDGKTDSAKADQSQVLSKIKSLQDELVKVERETRQGQTFESIESQWDYEFEAFGGESAQQNWASMQQMKAQSFVKDTTAFAIGREWARGSEDSFIWSMLERQQYDKQLTERRAQWEAKKGLTQPNVDDSLKPTWLQAGSYPPLQLPSFYDPMNPESRFNATPEAQGYDQQERQLRSQIHDLVRQKHDHFMRWNARPMIPMPRGPDDKLDIIWPKPIINYVHWKVFRFCSPFEDLHSEARKDFCAIDVLDGEPDLTVTKRTYDSLMRTMRNDGSKKPAGIPKMAEGHVPERIRLNGPQFAETFALIGDTHVPSIAPQMVLLEPYRLFVYHNQDIRNRYASLKEKLGASENQKDMSSTASVTQAPGQHEPAQSDVQQGRNENAHVGAQSSIKGEIGAETSPPVPDETHHDGAEEPPQRPEDKPNEDNADTQYPRANSKTALTYLECLIDFMDTTVLARRKYVRGDECRKIHFRDLWYLFNPGDEVIRRDGKQAYRVIEVINPTHRASSKNIFFNFDDDDRSTYFQVSCVFVDFDGRNIGPSSRNFYIKAFAGERSVDSLEVYPLRLHSHTAHQERKGISKLSGSDTLRQYLIKRGKKFFQAASMKLENTFYDGPTADGDEVESQVVVDFETALSSDDNFNEDQIPHLKSLLGDVDDSSSTLSDPTGAPPLLCTAPCCIGEYVFDDSFVDDKRKEEYIESLIPKSTYAKLPSVAIYPRTLDDTTGDNALTDDEFLLMSYRVFAFVLRTRKWAELDLTHMEDATESYAHSQENKEVVIQPAFDQLVLPEGHKNIVLSLISQHYRNRDSGRRSIDQSDIVRGKGKGLILLLHGAPGVGKTSTAEGIAEKFKKPLFTITCGDLGSTAKEVEQALDLNFNLANRWGCILLLDEADVFLSSRTEADFERNGLVAVFLRVLEYYAGILFLTTNRVGVIDEAFRSRIHISLYYPHLGFDETRAVFRLNLKLIQDRFNNDNKNINIDGDGIVDFALEYFRSNKHARWNGRQIRNACQTALALAEFKAQGGNHDQVLDPNADVVLEVENFKAVAKAYLEFTKYLMQLYDVDEDRRAKDIGIRAPDTSWQRQHQSRQPPVSDGNITRAGSIYGHAQTYNSAPGNSLQTIPGHSYQTAPMRGQVHINPNLGVQQPSQHVSYYNNHGQAVPAGNFPTYTTSVQSPSSQVPQDSQEFVGMQFRPAQGNFNQQGHQWPGLASPPSSATMPQSPAAQAQQQYTTQVQQGPGTTTLGGLMPTSQPFQAQQPMQQQQQQQAPQTWNPNMNVQSMQPAAGQNPAGTSSQEGGR